MVVGEWANHSLPLFELEFACAFDTCRYIGELYVYAEQKKEGYLSTERAHGSGSASGNYSFAECYFRYTMRIFVVIHSVCCCLQLPRIGCGQRLIVRPHRFVAMNPRHLFKKSGFTDGVLEQ